MEAKKIDQSKKYSYADYLTWNNPDERWELINGEAYDMSPAPNFNHQAISGEIYYLIKHYLMTNHLCFVKYQSIFEN